MHNNTKLSYTDIKAWFPSFVGSKFFPQVAKQKDLNTTFQFYQHIP